MPTTRNRWTVLQTRDVEKVMRRLPSNLVQRLDRAIRALASDPWPRGCKKLVGHENLYRIRVGDWRISYAVEDDQLIVLVLEVASRGDAYQF
jgi:mRNA interferase RelE/StbE